MNPFPRAPSRHVTVPTGIAALDSRHTGQLGAVARVLGCGWRPAAKDDCQLHESTGPGLTAKPRRWSKPVGCHRRSNTYDSFRPEKRQTAWGWNKKWLPAASNGSTSRRVPRHPGCVVARPRRPGGRTGNGFESRQDRDRGFRPPPRRNTDAEALGLREQGRSYAAIALALGFKRATDARQAFVRALRSHPDAERKQMVTRELQRLDELEGRIRTRDADAPEKLARRLAALAVLREGLD
jgi:hypothetical protein